MPIRSNYHIVRKDIDKMSKLEFAESRFNGFGASDMGKLLEVNPFDGCKRSDLINEKVNKIVDEQIGKLANVRKGNDLEDLILRKSKKLLQALYEGDEEDLDVIKVWETYGNDNNLNINFDGVLIEKTRMILPIEAKTVSSAYSRKQFNWKRAFTRTRDGAYDDGCLAVKPYYNYDEMYKDIKDYCIQAASYYGIPPYYFVQVQAQLDAMDCDYGYLAALNVDEWEVYLFKIYKHEVVCEEENRLCKIYWALIEARRKEKDLIY